MTLSLWLERHEDPERMVLMGQRIQNALPIGQKYWILSLCDGRMSLHGGIPANLTLGLTAEGFIELNDWMSIYNQQQTLFNQRRENSSSEPDYFDNEDDEDGDEELDDNEEIETQSFDDLANSLDFPSVRNTSNLVINSINTEEARANARR